jgi:hypothetical protein
MDIKGIIEQIFREDAALSHLDVSEGTNLHDLVVLPLVYLIENKLSGGVFDAEANKLDLGNIDSLTKEDVERIGKNQFVDIVRDSISRGEVRLYLTSPEAIEISSGTRFYAGKVEFISSYDVGINASDYGREGILYVSPPIMVENSGGEAIAENALGSMDSPPDTLVEIKHLAITNGMAPVTASQLYSAIKGSIIAKLYLNGYSISRLIHEKYKNAIRVEVAGAGDAEMTRDIVYNYVSPNNIINAISDFSGKIRGYIETDSIHVYNSNKAFRLYATEGELSAISGDAGIELTQKQYLSILEENTGYITITTKSILEEGFEQSSEMGGELAYITATAIAADTTLTVDDITGLEAGQVIKIISYDSDGNKSGIVVNVIKSIDQSTTTVELYSNIGIGIAHDTTPSPYIEVIEGLGITIGNGWIKGEDGLAYPNVITDKEIMVIDNELVMGMEGDSWQSNILIEAIRKTGAANFITAVNEAISLIYSTEEIISQNTGSSNAI